MELKCKRRGKRERERWMKFGSRNTQGTGNRGRGGPATERERKAYTTVRPIEGEEGRQGTKYVGKKRGDVKRGRFWDWDTGTREGTAGDNWNWDWREKKGTETAEEREKDRCTSVKRKDVPKERETFKRERQRNVKKDPRESTGTTPTMNWIDSIRQEDQEMEEEKGEENEIWMLLAAPRKGFGKNGKGTSKRNAVEVIKRPRRRRP